MKNDCWDFLGNRPCAHAKKTGAACDSCDMYRPRGVKDKVLIINFGGFGDVLQCTSILRHFSKSHVSFLTSERCFPVISQLKEIHTKYKYNMTDMEILKNSHFGTIINLDKSKDAAAAATTLLPHCYEPKGYFLNWRGDLTCTEGFEYEFELGLSDAKFRANTISRYHRICTALELTPMNDRPIVSTPADFSLFGGKSFGSFYDKIGRKDMPIVGLVTNTGGIACNRVWKPERYAELIESVRHRWVLLGGEADKKTNQEIVRINGLTNYVLNTTIRDWFPSYTELCTIISKLDVIFTPDSLCLHIARAHNIPTVSMFTSTPHRDWGDRNNEIKLVIDRECAGCYNKSCEKECYNDITVDQVRNSIGKLHGKARRT